MRTRRAALTLLLLAFMALVLGASAVAASPLEAAASAALAQQTGGSFGGSRWGSGAPSAPSAPSGGSWSGGGSSSSSGGSWSGHRSSSGGHDSGAFDLVVAFIYLVVWCFSVSPILGFAVLGVGIGFVVFVFAQRG